MSRHERDVYEVVASVTLLGAAFVAFVLVIF